MVNSDADVGIRSDDEIIKLFWGKRGIRNRRSDSQIQRVDLLCGVYL